MVTVRRGRRYGPPSWRPPMETAERAYRETRGSGPPQTDRRRRRHRPPTWGNISGSMVRKYNDTGSFTCLLKSKLSLGTRDEYLWSNQCLTLSEKSLTADLMEATL